VGAHHTNPKTPARELLPVMLALEKTDVNQEAVGCFVLLLLLISLAILEAEIGWRSKRQLGGLPS